MAETSFGSFGGQKGDARSAPPGAAPQVARPNNSMANDLSNSAAKNQAMRSFDDSQRGSEGTLRSNRKDQAEASAASAISNAQRTSAAAVAPSPAPVLRPPEAPSAAHWARQPAVQDTSAAYERNRRIQAERVAAERERDLDDANARAYRAQAQQSAGGSRSVNTAQIGGQGSTSRPGMGVGLAAGAAAGAVLATAATSASAKPAPPPGESPIATTASTDLGVAGDTAGFSPTVPDARSVSASKGDGSDSSHYVLLLAVIAMGAGMFFWMRSRWSEVKGRYSL